MRFKCGIEVPSDTQALLFDLDGTLVDNMHLHVEAWIYAGQEFNIPITGQMIHDNAGIPTLQLIDKLSSEYGWDVNHKEFTQLKQSSYRAIKAQSGPIRKIPAIIEIAHHFHKKIPMTIGTGSSKQNAIAALEDAEIIQLFDLIVTADDVVHPKPHPEVYLKGAQYVNADPSKCLVFEDGDKGIQSAIAAGMSWIDVRGFI